MSNKNNENPKKNKKLWFTALMLSFGFLMLVFITSAFSGKNHYKTSEITNFDAVERLALSTSYQNFERGNYR